MREITVMEGAHELAHTRDLGVDVAAPFRMARFGFPAALVVRGVRERAMLAGVDDGDGDLVWEGNHLVLQRGAIEQQRATPPSQG